MTIRDFNMKTAILLITFAVLGADQVHGQQKSPQKEVKFGALCSGNPSNTIRGCDIYGCGAYGASRGAGEHKGVDIICTDGDTVYAPFDLEISRKTHSYGTGYGIDNGVLFKGEGLCFKLLYVKPEKYSGTFKKGEKMGKMLPMQLDYPGITSHVHVQMCDNTEDPTKYF